MRTKSGVSSSLIELRSALSSLMCPLPFVDVTCPLESPFGLTPRGSSSESNESSLDMTASGKIDGGCDSDAGDDERVSTVTLRRGKSGG